MSKPKNAVEAPEATTRIELRHLELTDYFQLKESMLKAYPNWKDSSWTRPQIRKLLDIFPEGQLGILVNDKVVGCALSIIVDYDQFGNDHTYEQITGQDTFSTHNPNGNVLYGIDIFIHPEYRGMRLGRRLYDARKELCENLNLRSIIFGGRIPKYNEYADEMGPKEYIQKVRRREIYDPTLTFQLANDFHPLKVLKDYQQGDLASLDYAVLLEWNNVYYQSKQQVVNQTKTVIRLGLVQWQMRSFKDVDALIEQMEFFVDAVSDYQSDFIVFPEFFNAPLMAPYNHLPEPQAIRELAAYSAPLRQKAVEFAVSYNVNIILGSMPYLEGESLLNVGFLCRRDGSWESYEKIHITPSESSAWGMVGGNKVKALDTDCGKIGVLICYDSEFPELSRILADQGMRILFVPFLTDTPNGFTRVRSCAMARAIENECYVAIAGCVGNLPRVNNMDIQFAQSAVYTPADFAFPTNGIKAEAPPNTEMTVIADVDLELLKELHEHGSVRNMKDRRHDLYELKLKNE
jgi:predicted amidohydrolase/ribosomal protein S18 acetylase RimI-like enzyme